MNWLLRESKDDGRPNLCRLKGRTEGDKVEERGRTMESEVGKLVWRSEGISVHGQILNLNFMGSPTVAGRVGAELKARCGGEAG